MHLSPAARRSWIVCALAAILTLALISSASAAVTQTQITSPGDPYFDVANSANATEQVTVSGTSDGTTGDVVDLVCFGTDNTENPSPGQDLAVNADGTFSGQVDLFDISDMGYSCTLRAVPNNTTPSNTSPYKGPRMLITYFEPPSTDSDTPVHNGGTVKDDVYADFEGLRGRSYIYELSDDPLYEFAWVDPRNLFSQYEYNSYWPFDTAAEIEDAQDGGREPIQVDGENAYHLKNLPIADYDANSGTAPSYPDGVESIQASIAQDGEGNVTITERYPLYRCDDNSVYPPNTTSCDSVDSAGVRLERTKQTSDSGATISVTDTWVSSDGGAHDVRVEYYEESETDNEYTEYNMPGTDGYSQHEEHDLFEWPDTAPATMHFRDSSYGGGYSGAGAITEMQAPDNTTWDEYDVWFTRFNAIGVPAGGSSTLVQHYHVARTSDEVEDLAAARRDPLSPPVVTITGPAEGSVLGSDSVNVIGTASDDVGVTSLNVNGIPTTVNPDGTFAQRVSLAPGRNVLTATATDRAGNSSQSVVNVTFAPGAGTPPGVAPPPPGRGVSSVQLRTRRLRLARTLRLRLRCVAGAQNGTLEVRTSKRPRRILGTKAFQCPAGGTRTVAFRLSKKRFRELRRKGRQRIVVDIVGRDLSGEAGIFSSRLTLLAPRRARRRG